MAMQWLVINGVSLVIALLVISAIILSTEILAMPPFTSFRSRLSVQGGSSRFHDCQSSPQGWPIFANKMERVNREFFFSMQDIGVNRNEFQRMLEGKLFSFNEISGTIQGVLEHLKGQGTRGVVVDVGANVGLATFAASAMGFHVLALEPVEENVNKLCDGIYFNRASNLVKIVHAAVSDSPGVATLHKVAGRYDNTAVSRVGATVYVKSEVIPFEVEMVTIDSVVADDLEVALLKVDVQGWELHVFKGATKLLSRPPDRAPYVLYEEVGPMLEASNTSGAEIAEFLESVGYKEYNCVKVGADRHCSKRLDDLTWVNE